MERSRGIQKEWKKVVTAMALAAALASTGCSGNALLNPTADHVQAAGSGGGSASTAGHNANPSGHNVNP